MSEQPTMTQDHGSTATADQPAQTTGEAGRRRRNRLTGRIVRVGTPHTTYVAVQYYVQHTKYRKNQVFTRKFAVHHEHEQELHEGDVVEIVSCRPMSRTKRFRLARVVKAAQVITADTDLTPVGTTTQTTPA